MDFAIISSFALLLQEFQSCFTKPLFDLFKALAIGWLVTSGRKTITNIVKTMGDTAKSHDAYQNFHIVLKLLLVQKLRGCFF